MSTMNLNNTKILIIAFLLFMSDVVKGQDERFFSHLDYKIVMSSLFDNATFNSMQEALWKPNYSERINMPVSDDGFCHTVLDTTLYYSSASEKHAVLIFATYEYHNGIRTSCHVCSPLLSIATFRQEDNKSWIIEQFKKDFIGLGAWGKKLGQLSIEKLGTDFYCLKVKSAIYGNQGYESGVTSFYSLNSYEQLNEVFSFVYFDSNEGAMEEGKGSTKETSIKLIPNAGSYFDIVLITNRSSAKNMITKKYKYSENEGHYIPILN